MCDKNTKIVEKQSTQTKIKHKKKTKKQQKGK